MKLSHLLNIALLLTSMQHHPLPAQASDNGAPLEDWNMDFAVSIQLYDYVYTGHLWRIPGWHSVVCNIWPIKCSEQVSRKCISNLF